MLKVVLKLLFFGSSLWDLRFGSSCPAFVFVFALLKSFLQPLQSTIPAALTPDEPHASHLAVHELKSIKVYILDKKHKTSGRKEIESGKV